MKRSFLTFALLSAIYLGALQSTNAQQTFDWAQFVSLWKTYTAHPTSTNAKRVADILPYPKHVDYTNSPLETRSLQSMEQGFTTLERKVLSGDHQAVRLAFRLFSLSDGALAEALDQMLGRLIVRNPTLFLEQLKAHEQLFIDYDYAALGGLIGNFGVEFVDNEKAQTKEAKSRINALLRVQRDDLRPLRDRCISHLREMLNR